ncbi:MULTISPECIES: putative cytokinetic ring protein SteA [Dermabacter]|uniref:putative cytokinetic ring protein SteA n=1 Tax=Dermabacter TaxID=36739 RepID=UPI000C7565B6|nr:MULTISPECIES: putative cytokinetic ring protein SteA [Dermabacter]MCT1956290.1 putative cytokinetic ring protein SteA [Dermabacter hominis]MCT2056502.1 putative cytokinetic ring protein SteA [Dermabacter hominis]MCT2083117.1 putative cytokinetic ring protein SteA [Dermabacter hominis]MCT2092042.1 putative cytokinetic ring protein SteA [Dermabacter hominis]MCT2190454.1 putative cytokinetic ring protein SteA [Dermabacter hominis]
MKPGFTFPIAGRAKVGKRTKDLTKRVEAGDIVVIDHEDLDRVAAEALVDRAPAAVLNASPSISGRYPNAGPQILVEAGIPVLDVLDQDLFATVREGRFVEIDESGVSLSTGERLEAELYTPAVLNDKLDKAREGLSEQLEAFASNTMEYMLRERELLINGVGTPEVRTRFQGRPVLIVVRGYHYREDLVALMPFIRENRPIIIGVDGGADAVLDAGYGLDMIIGDMDSVSDRALASGAEIVVHAYRDGRAPGMERIRELGLADDAVTFAASGTSEDIAMLLADDRGADVIVAVGTHGTLEEFLDKGRAGMSSTFLTRLRVGSKLVDAKGVSRLYRQRISTFQLVLLVVAGLLALAVAMAVTDGGQTLIQILGARLDDTLRFFTALFVQGGPIP